MVLAIAGTLLRLWAIDTVSASFSDTISSIIEVVVDHRELVVGWSVTVVVVGLALERRRGATQLDDLMDLEHEVEAIDAEMQDEEPMYRSERGDWP